MAANVDEAAKEAEEAEETKCSNEVFTDSCYLRVNNISTRIDKLVCAHSRTSADCSQARRQFILVAQMCCWQAREQSTNSP